MRKIFEWKEYGTYYRVVMSWDGENARVMAEICNGRLDALGEYLWLDAEDKFANVVAKAALLSEAGFITGMEK